MGDRVPAVQLADDVVGGAIPGQFIPAVEKGVIVGAPSTMAASAMCGPGTSPLSIAARCAMARGIPAATAWLASAICNIAGKAGPVPDNALR